MNRPAKTSPRRIYRFCAWVARLGQSWFPWHFSWRPLPLQGRVGSLWASDLWAFRCAPVIRPKRRPVSLDIEEFAKLEAPTPVVASDPGTAYLLREAILHEPLPPVVQVAQS